MINGKLFHVWVVGGIFLSAASAFGTITLRAEMSGQVHVKIQDEQHFRHSLKCYVMGKGNELHDLGEQVLNLDGGEQAGAPGLLTWTSTLRSPFVRAIRSLSLTSSSTNSKLSETIQLQLTDSGGYQRGQFAQSECGHHDGITRTEQASIQGKILVQYQVPKNVWAVRVRREGEMLLKRSNHKPLAGVLNPGYDLAKSDDETFWAQPGSVLTQEIEIQPGVFGASDLGSAKIEFIPLGAVIGSPQEFDSQIVMLRSDIDKIRRLDRKTSDQDLEKFIQNAATLLHNPEALGAGIRRMPTRDVTQLSQSLFVIANSVFISGTKALPTKTIAALVAYELSTRLLREMSPYCESVELYLPMSDRKITTLGLRVAGFWLNRSLTRVRSYGFEQYDALLSELSILESTGVTYAQVMKDAQTLKKLKNSYELLSESLDLGASPFGAAAKDVKRTLDQFGSIGAGDNETSALIRQLAALDSAEARFVQNLLSTLRRFSVAEEAPIRVSALVMDLNAIKDGQKQISLDMSKNIRLLSIDKVDESSGVMKTIVQLMSNQIAIFEEPLSQVPYFENIRKTYLAMNSHDELLKKMKTCMFGGEQK